MLSILYIQNNSVKIAKSLEEAGSAQMTQNKLGN